MNKRLTKQGNWEKARINNYVSCVRTPHQKQAFLHEYAFKTAF